MLDYNLDKIKISVIGLGYVGLPLAVEFSKKFTVIGFDLNEKRIKELEEGYDQTNEISNSELASLKNIAFVSDSNKIAKSDFFIITVPTPVDKNNTPDLTPLKSASTIVSKHIEKGNIIVYESTVYPGCTEEICVPILEEGSSLKYNKDFYCGYSPERINPGDREHTLKTITKITSGSNDYSSNKIDALYKSIIPIGTFKASSIAVAEAAKVIENTQRDVNIALINELSLIFDKLDLDTTEVIEAASTKWNFLPFKPGLVGGHCIGVDPYYLTHKAAEVGYHPEIILAGRRINDNMGYFIAERTISELAKVGISPFQANIAILGLTFKENCPDLRNTKVMTIIEKLNYYKCNLSISDPWADKNEANSIFGIKLSELKEITNQDAIIITVGHNEFSHFNDLEWKSMLKPNGVVVDVKSIYSPSDFKDKTIRYWRL